MKKKAILKNIYMRLFPILLLAFCFAFCSPCFTSYAYELPEDLDNLDQVTLGVFAYDEDIPVITQGPECAYSDYFVYYLTAGLYSRFKDTYSVGSSDIYMYLNSLADADFVALKNASSNGWLVDCSLNGIIGTSGNDNVYRLVFYVIKNPTNSSSPELIYSASAPYDWTFLHSNGSCYFLHDTNYHRVLQFVPDYVAVSNNQNNGYSMEFYNSQGFTYDHVSDCLNDSNVVGFTCSFDFSVNDNGIYLSKSTSSKCSYFTSSNAFTSVNFRALGSNSSLVGSVGPDENWCFIFTAFPFYDCNNVTKASNSYYFNFNPVDNYFTVSSLTPFYIQAFQPEAVEEDIYTSLPTLFSILNREYTFSVMDINIPFNPFAVFVCCVLLGLMVRIFYNGGAD